MGIDSLIKILLLVWTLVTGITAFAIWAVRSEIKTETIAYAERIKTLETKHDAVVLRFEDYKKDNGKWLDDFRGDVRESFKSVNDRLDKLLGKE